MFRSQISHPSAGSPAFGGIAYAPSLANRSVSSFLMVREIGFREIVPVSPEARRQYAFQVLLGPMSMNSLRSRRSLLTHSKPMLPSDPGEHSGSPISFGRKRRKARAAASVSGAIGS